MPIGLYIHVPFCLSKCPYCDFYSLPLAGDDGLLDRYTASVEQALDRWADRLRTPADTLYFGGGTPSLLGGKRLVRLIGRAERCFSLDDAEITLEANPADADGEGGLSETLKAFADAGGTRLSLGMQSASEAELHRLGRRHGPAAVWRAVETARRAGIADISLDLMLAVEGQDETSVRRSASLCGELGAGHVSAYLLKIEDNTPFGRNRHALALPGEDEAASLYLAACETLEEHGFHQYEISNFALPGRESRHNLKYWRCQEYLGVGPAAHSFLGGRRFYFPRDLAGFVNASDSWEQVVQDGSGGDAQEQLMMRLRLREGIDLGWFARSFSLELEPMYKRAQFLQKHGLLELQKGRLFLTPQGFLLSNSVISDLLAEIF